MRLHMQQPERQKASVLVTALALAFILGLTLAGYLSWVRTQHRLVAESQAWNAALAFAEGGIEEGLAQINVSLGTNYLDSALTNWGWSGSGFYGPRSYTFTNNGSYNAIIVPGSPGPSIISTGYVSVPIIGRQIARTVEVRTKAVPAFGYGISVIRNVGMNGNYVMIDSYDSGDPAFSTGGQYDPLKRKAGGDVVSTDGFIDVGGADIYGHVRTAPWGSVSVQQMNGRVGDLPQNWNGSGIEDGWYQNDLNLDFEDVGQPFTGGSSLPLLTATNSYVLTSQDYLVNGDFQLLSGQTLYVLGTPRLWVQGNVRFRNGSIVSIQPASSLSLYVGTVSPLPATTADISYVSSGNNPTNFSVFGLPSTVNVNWSGNDTYVGSIYAPEANMVLTGGGSTSTNDFQGSCVVGSLTMNGVFNFHFDERLKTQGFMKGYVVTSWREL